MKLKKETINLWREKFEYSFPGLLLALSKQEEDVFLIGASLLDIYVAEGWIDKFSRTTGDADFTIEFNGTAESYKKVCDELISLGYQKDEIHPYRYHPVKKQGIYAYIDLLVFTTEPKLEEKAKQAMSVGENFNFQGMDFAQNAPLHFTDNIYFPNPIALIYLKMKSYYYNPERLKDFVDFLEILLRLSTTEGMLNLLNESIKYDDFPIVKNDILKMCNFIETDKGRPWDLVDIENDLDERLLLEEFGIDEIVELVEYFRKNIFP